MPRIGHMRLTASHLDAYADGCAFLGCGGGGDVRAAMGLLRQVLTAHGGVDVVDVGSPKGSSGAELLSYDDSTCALTGAVGSATVMVERLPGAVEFVRAVELLAQARGPLDALAPLEIGGVNGLLGLVAAARLGLPVLDADGMGRTFPRLGQTTLAQAVPLCPVALAEPSGGSIVVDCPSHEAAEEAVHGVLPALGSWAAVAFQWCAVATFAQHAVRGSITRALAVGQALAACRTLAANAEDVDDVLVGCGVRTAWTGTVTEVLRWGAAPRGGVATIPHRDDPNHVLRLDFADEIYLALADGMPLAGAPDIVAPLDARTWKVVGVDALRAGQHLRILTMPAPVELVRHTPRLGLDAYGATDPSTAHHSALTQPARRS